mmetsp:Transcript_44700/g.95129  ORF Transcript_44700/g.95129 Transcript_44700/m.95129 type:complete len:226 (+) Transcript_44700:723-1400(+)
MSHRRGGKGRQSGEPEQPEERKQDGKEGPTESAEGLGRHGQHWVEVAQVHGEEEDGRGAGGVRLPGRESRRGRAGRGGQQRVRIPAARAELLGRSNILFVSIAPRGKRRRRGVEGRDGDGQNARGEDSLLVRNTVEVCGLPGQNGRRGHPPVRKVVGSRHKQVRFQSEANVGVGPISPRTGIDPDAALQGGRFFNAVGRSLSWCAHANERCRQGGKTGGQTRNGG